jgi:predicted GNAT family acetyltransferase
VPIIDVTVENLENEHICCAISEKKGETCVSSKKSWMAQRFNDGLVFKKLDERGKVLIEYIPAEKAWCPIDANNFIHINCFWVSGKFKGQGYANELLNECILDAKSKGKDGLTVISSKKKMPFLSDPKYLKYKGFITADYADPYFELLYLPFKEDVDVPKFKKWVSKYIDNKNGFVLYYANQCPHTDKYAPIVKEIADNRNIKFELVKFETTDEAQSAPSPFTSYSLFYNGEFVTNEILSEKKFNKLLNDIGI